MPPVCTWMRLPPYLKKKNHGRAASSHPPSHLDRERGARQKEAEKGAKGRRFSLSLPFPALPTHTPPPLARGPKVRDARPAAPLRGPARIVGSKRGASEGRGGRRVAMRWSLSHADFPMPFLTTLSRPPTPPQTQPQLCAPPSAMPTFQGLGMSSSSLAHTGFDFASLAPGQGKEPGREVRRGARPRFSCPCFRDDARPSAAGSVCAEWLRRGLGYS